MLNIATPTVWTPPVVCMLSYMVLSALLCCAPMSTALASEAPSGQHTPQLLVYCDEGKKQHQKNKGYTAWIGPIVQNCSAGSFLNTATCWSRAVGSVFPTQRQA